MKENVDVAGSATTLGLVARADAVATLDAPAVASLRAAGAIPMARTNLPDYALRWHTDNALHGATRNPWDATRTPGGSSGGEAAALAVGMTPLGFGNDLGGSLRYPSQARLRAWSEFQVEHPIVLGPVSTSPPFRVGTDLDRDGAAGVLAAMRLVVTVNVLGLPSVAVPVGMASGLPQAVQLIGPRFREDLCLDAAETIEHASGVLTPIDPR